MSSSTPTDLQQHVTGFLDQCQPGYQILELPLQDGTAHMAAEVSAGLSSKYNRTLPCTYFYDARGSQLYEEITQLPEYYPTRTEAALLEQISPTLQELLTDRDNKNLPLQIVELGSGSSAKTRLLLNAWTHQPMVYIPIDVSESMLSFAARRLADSYPHLTVLGLAGEYEDALSLLPPHANRLFLFLGGTIGNFTPAFQNQFFTTLARRMETGAKLLLGFDRQPHTGKPVERIEAAYNDSQGITDQFNLNILSHINHRLGGHFNLNHWRHQAIYNHDEHQIEMYLESLTEISRKFDPDELADWFRRKGFECHQQWTDPAENFGLMLLEIR
jgi:L-histidine Nalpha-methyltransferase